jgi:hypothetical protein
MPTSSTSDRSKVGSRWLLNSVFPTGIANAIDGNVLKCKIEPGRSICGRCGNLRADWYPKTPPQVHLYIRHESLDSIGVGCHVVHRRLFEILQQHLELAMVSACISTPDSPLQVGENYVAVSTPAQLNTYRREPMLMTDPHCSECGSLGGWGGMGSYVYFNIQNPQSDVLVVDSKRLLVTKKVRDMIDQDLSASFNFCWDEVPVYSLPLPYHRIQKDNLGPPEPPPLPPTPNPPSAPRQPKKKRGGLS